MEYSLNPDKLPFFRIIIAGSRDFLDYKLLCNKVSAIIFEKKKTNNICQIK